VLYGGSRPWYGGVKRVINFDVLRQLLGDNAVEDAPEAYEFNWVGKQAARAEVLEPIKKTLRPVKEDSVDWDNTQNLYIEGDNLKVLKLLQKSYLGKVKMIYIDPPYNTGNDFVYHDDFAMSADEYAEASGSVDELGNKYIKNMDSNGRFHSDWCSMMYSRLMVARSLLSEDGVIFISIDEHEEENLKKISNEIFGCSNFVGTIIWERAFAPKNDAKYLSDSHDYVLVFAKTIDKFQIGLLPRSEEANARYKNPDNDPRGPWTADNMTVKTYSANYDYEIVTPNGSVMSPPNGRCWFTSKERMDKLIQENRVWFGETGGNMPRLKRFLCDVQQGMTATTIWKYTEVGHNQEGRQELKKLFDNKGYFDGPKPLRLISRILTIANLSANSIILDFFSGSATTAHAVMQLNAEDGGKRKYIMVQLPEETPEDSEARKAGYNTLPEIAKERIRRAGKKIKEESPLTTADLDTGFRVFRLEEGNYEDVKLSPKDYNQDDLDLFLNNIKTDRNDLDLLFGCMLDWGVQLSLPMTQEVVDGKTIYTVNDGDLVACFAENVSEDVVKAMAEKMPLRVIFRDSCFAQDADKINIYETFKQKLDWSDQEVVKNIRVI
jgi:adenine-specific DNA-methyltransferase